MTTAEQYQRLIGHVDHAPAILHRLSTGDLPAAFTCLDKPSPASPTPRPSPPTPSAACATSSSCAAAANSQDRHRPGRPANLALALDTPTVVAALKVLWQLKTQLRPTTPAPAWNSPWSCSPRSSTPTTATPG
jgi:hypothetical protein